MGSQVWDITTVNKRKISPVISHSLPLATWGPLWIAHKIPSTTTPISINKQDLKPGQDNVFLRSLFAIVIPHSALWSESYVVTTCHFKNHFAPLHLRECGKCIHLVIFRRVIDFFLDFSQTRPQYSQSKNNNVLTSQHIYSLFLHVVTVHCRFGSWAPRLPTSLWRAMRRGWTALITTAEETSHILYQGLMTIWSRSGIIRYRIEIHTVQDLLPSHSLSPTPSCGPCI